MHEKDKTQSTYFNTHTLNENCLRLECAVQKVNADWNQTGRLFVFPLDKATERQCISEFKNLTVKNTYNMFKIES